LTGSAQAATVVISPFANERWKEWPIPHYRRFIERALGEGAAVVVVGTRSQRCRANEVVRGFSASEVVNLCGRTTWGHLVAIIDSASYVVCNNSGIAHLAASRGRWTLCIHAEAMSYLEWLPHGPHVVLLGRVTPCSPCDIGDGGGCPHRMACMRELLPDEAYEAFRDARVLSTAGDPQTPRLL